MLVLCLMVSVTYYAQNYASIILLWQFAKLTVSPNFIAPTFNTCVKDSIEVVTELLHHQY